MGEETIPRKPEGISADISYRMARNRLTTDLFSARHKSALNALCSHDNPVGTLDLEVDSVLDAMAGAMSDIQAEHGAVLTHAVCNPMTLGRIIRNAREHGYPIEPPTSSPMPYTITLPNCKNVKVVTDPGIPDIVRMTNPALSLFHENRRYLVCRPQSDGHVVSVVDRHRHAAMYVDAETGKKYSATLVIRRRGNQDPTLSGDGYDMPPSGHWHRVLQIMAALARTGLFKEEIAYLAACLRQAVDTILASPILGTVDARIARALDPLSSPALRSA
ncbi:MAG: hypothetical protein OXU25_04430 [Thaumarchaeota archaeon]|nr:hypothetical protein [Nitrososphaerota archaeon]